MFFGVASSYDLVTSTEEKENILEISDLMNGNKYVIGQMAMFRMGCTFRSIVM